MLSMTRLLRSACRRATGGHAPDTVQQDWLSPTRHAGPGQYHGYGLRHIAAAAVLTSALTAHQLVAVLTADVEHTTVQADDPPSDTFVVWPFGADGGSPQFLDVPPPQDTSNQPVRAVSAEKSDSSGEQDKSNKSADLVAHTIDTTGLATGVPTTVLHAYHNADNHVDNEQPNCGLSVPLLAAIGRVESYHARGGNVDNAGRTLSPIIGLQLNGGPNVALIRDTDGGRFDGDTAYDRAVGPMQFIPSTWARWAADGNSDRVTDPHNVFDASLAAGRYLCAAGHDLTTSDGLTRAILAYNHSGHYLRTVLSWMQVYSGNAIAVPDGSINVPAPSATQAKSAKSRVAKHSGGTNPSQALGGKGKTSGADSSKPPAKPASHSSQQRSSGTSGSSGSGSNESSEPAPEPQPARENEDQSGDSSGGSGNEPDEDPDSSGGTDEQPPPDDNDSGGSDSGDGSGDGSGEDGGDGSGDDDSGDDSAIQVNPNPPDVS